MHMVTNILLGCILLIQFLHLASSPSYLQLEELKENHTGIRILLRGIYKRLKHEYEE